MGMQTKTKIVIAHDAVMSFASVWVTFLLTFRFSGFDPARILPFAIGFMLLALVCMAIGGVYKRIWRYASIGDLVNIAWMLLLAQAIAAPAFIMGIRADTLAYSYVIVHVLVCSAALCVPRFAYRAWREGHFDGLLPHGWRRGEGRANIVLIGAGSAADTFLRLCENKTISGYRVIGILDADDSLQGRTLRGVPVLGSPADLGAVLATLKSSGKLPQRIVFSKTEQSSNAEKTFAKASVRQITEIAQAHNIMVGRLPSLTQFDQGQFAAESDAQFQPKPLDIEDLLGRPQAQLNLQGIEGLIKGKSVLISGAGGSIGSELARQIAGFGPRHLVCFDHSEFHIYEVEQSLSRLGEGIEVTCVLADIRNRQEVERLFKIHKPDLVFHAAALKHVPIVELQPAQGVLTNVMGTRIMADMAAQFGVQAFVQISTDKAVNPANIMGASKRLGEYYAQALDLTMGRGETRFMTVRFGNVLGSSGSVVPLFRKQLEAGGPLTVTHEDIKRYFMTVREAVGLVLQASAGGMDPAQQRGSIYVLDMGKPIRIMDIARQMIRLSELQPDVDIKIDVTGLRPGEKLFEELFDDSESKIETNIPSTFAARPQPIDLPLLRQSLDQLVALAQKGDDAGVAELVARIVPGYCGGESDKSQKTHK